MQLSLTRSYPNGQISKSKWVRSRIPVMHSIVTIILKVVLKLYLLLYTFHIFIQSSHAACLRTSAVVPNILRNCGVWEVILRCDIWEIKDSKQYFFCNNNIVASIWHGWRIDTIKAQNEANVHEISNDHPLFLFQWHFYTYLLFLVLLFYFRNILFRRRLSWISLPAKQAKDQMKMI